MGHRLYARIAGIPLRLALGLALFASLAFSVPPLPETPASATAAIDVTTQADEYDTTGTGTGCSLREAIVSANTDSAFGGCSTGSGADVILLPSGTYSLTIPGLYEDESATGDLDVRSSVIISGTDSDTTIIHGNSIDRVFDVSGTISVEMDNLTVRGGYVFGAIAGGILNRTSALTLSHTAVISNISNVGTGGVTNMGGALVIDRSSILGNGLRGIHNDSGGSLRLVDSLVQGNFGGAMTVGGNVVIESSQIISHTGAEYSIIYSGQVSETMTIVSSTVSFNEGGILHNGSGSLTIADSTFSNNYQSGVEIVSGQARVTMLNSTFSGNQIGIDASTGMLDLFNVTISNNTSGNFNGGGIMVTYPATVTLQNTLIAGNTDPGGEAPDCSGTLVSLGYNLIESTQGCTLTGTSTGNILGQPPGLGALQYNGGFGLTHALLSGSPAINAGNPAGCSDGQGDVLLADQRGWARIDRCDIGAFEYLFAGFQQFLPLIKR